MKKFLSHPKLFWVLLGLLTLFLTGLLPAAFVEKYYSRGLFLGIRWAFAALSGWWPFAFVYLLFFGVLGWLGRCLYRFFKSQQSWPKRLWNLLFNALAFVGGVVFLFQFLWGFNYKRIPLEDSMGIAPAPLSIPELRAELDSTTAEVLRIRALLPGAGDSVVPASLVPPHLEKTLRENLKNLLTELGYPTPGNMRGRLLWPKGILLRISTAGVYIPFTGEGHIDPGLHYLQLPFVMIHEMSHGYGFGDEGTCNFLAYLACTRSDDPFLQYVGHLYYWRYVASDYRDFQPDEYAAFRDCLPQGLRSDLLAIVQEMEKYPDIFPTIRDATYSAYLHAQGIEEGLKNYDRVIMLVHAWRKR
jgi:hypothetical protein